MVSGIVSNPIMTKFLVQLYINSCQRSTFIPPRYGPFLLFIFDLTIDSLMQNRLLGWELANAQGNHTLSQPVLAIYPKQVRFLDSSHPRLSQLIIIAL